MEKKKPARSGKTLRNTTLVAALMLTALSLSACVVPIDRDYRGDGHRRHHWNNDDEWNGGPGGGWQGDGDGSWHHHR